MESKDIDIAMKSRSPVVYNGKRYERIAEYVMSYDDNGKRRLSCGLIEQRTQKDAMGNEAMVATLVRVPAAQVSVEGT